MTPAPFSYRRAGSVDEAVALLEEWGEEARLLAGGQSLMPLLNARLARPACLVDVNGIGGLGSIEARNGDVSIGALTRHAQVEWSPVVAERLPLLADIVRLVGDRQVRLRGTLGGSLAHADPTGELPLAALTLGARVRAKSTGGSRELPAEDFFQGYYTTDLAPAEMITEIVFPAPPGRVTACAEVARRHGDFAILAVAAAGEPGPEGTWRALRIGLGGVADRPVLCTEAATLAAGRRLGRDERRAIGEACIAAAHPRSDIRASAEYRQHLIPIYVERVLAALEERRAVTGG
jgi:carbon-monoxide dehydrogenase medium subunit